MKPCEIPRFLAVNLRMVMEKRDQSKLCVVLIFLLLADEVITSALMVIFILQFHPLLDFRVSLSIFHMFIE